MKLFAGTILTLTALLLAPVALAQAAVTLEGQVVCSDCWFEQKDRKANPYGTEGDMKCAVRCSKDDVPQALAVWSGDSATLYLLENGAFKKDGKDFLAFTGKMVEITGTTRTAGDKKFLRVDALKVVSGDAAPATASPTASANAEGPRD